jgi:tetratricopeptide (TPR) repeat protein
VDAHLLTCGACRDLVAASAQAVLAPASRLAEIGATRGPGAPLPPSSPGLLARGTTVGRYVILGLVGRGGMGEVYAAYDPELDRKIALKLLNDGGTASESQARSRGRLLKEAKAIARLSHPNVVVVHDAGTIDDRVFIAMEFVDGQTLAAWLGGKPRPWPEIRQVFLAAGRGLAAAHAMRIIHRDFKPQNVMVAADGTVRVMDFGLASDAGDVDSEVPVEPLDRDRVDFSRTMANGLTRTGSLIGTPAYMAPEQFSAQAADARTDQFSYCVSLYEAVYGERPFAANSLAGLFEAVTAGRIREPPPRSRVPTWLRKLLLRGLAVKREDRFPAMEDLLAALSRDPERQRRRALIAVSLAGVLLAGGALGQRALQGSSAAMCRNPAERLAAAWEQPDASPGAAHPRRDAVRAAFLATGVRRAADVWDRTAGILDAYAKRWMAMYGETCEATHVRGEQSADVLDLRMDCLNGHRDSLRALTDLLATADVDMVSKAIDAARSLPNVERCADVAVLRVVLPVPRDPLLRQQVERLRQRVAEARALGATGRWQQGIAKARPLLQEAEKLGYQPVVAEISSLLGWFDGMIGEMKRAAEESERALWTAEATRHDEVAAEAAVMLVGIGGYLLQHAEEGERWGRFADAILKRMGPGHERLEGWLAHNRGVLRLYSGALDTAESELLASVAHKRKADGGDSADVAESINSLGELHARRGDYVGALELTDQARAIFDHAHGPEGVMSGRGYNNRCEYLSSLGRHAEALDSCNKAVAIFEAVFGRDHAWLGYPLTGAGIALIGLHRPRDALVPLRRAFEIRRHIEPGGAERGETLFALARAQWDAGDSRVAARAAAKTAREEYVKAPATEAKVRSIDAWLAAHDGRATP